MAGLLRRSAVILKTARNVFKRNDGTTIRRLYSSNTMANCGLVIFDKDGTLIRMESGWAEWTVKMTNKYAERLNKPIHEELYKILGYDAKTNRFKEGVLCDTNENIIKCLINYLTRHGLSDKEAASFAEENFFRYDASTHETVPIDDPREVMRQLRVAGVKTAVCTSDARAGNDQMMDALNLKDVVDMTSCGDDPEHKPKPDPVNIHTICKQLNVPVERTVMVGDSTRDMIMGKQAKVQCCVGVLTGVCDEKELSEVADVIVPTFTSILKVVMQG